MSYSYYSAFFITPPSGGTVYDVSVSDSVDISDSDNTLADFSRAIASILDVTDYLSASVVSTAIVRVLSDALEITDGITRSRHLFRAVDDGTDVFSGRIFFIERSVRVADNIDISSLLLTSRWVDRSTSDDVELVDAISAALGKVISAVLSDVISLTDDINKNKNIVRAAIDNALITDYTSVSVDLVRQLLSAAVISDLSNSYNVFNRLALSDIITGDSISVETGAAILQALGIIKHDVFLRPIMTDVNLLNVVTGVG